MRRMQRTKLGWVGIAALLFAGLGACGGKVVIDADGSGGEGGASSSNSTTTSSTGTNTTVGSSTGTSGGGGGCIGGECSGGPDGSCSCAGTCQDNPVQAECFGQPGGAVCLCSLNGMQVGKCDSPSDVFPCDIQFGCCAAFFP